MSSKKKTKHKKPKNKHQNTAKLLYSLKENTSAGVSAV